MAAKISPPEDKVVSSIAECDWVRHRTDVLLRWCTEDLTQGHCLRHQATRGGQVTMRSHRFSSASNEHVKDSLFTKISLQRCTYRLP